jgi:hypothetical protein
LIEAEVPASSITQRFAATASSNADGVSLCARSEDSMRLMIHIMVAGVQKSAGTTANHADQRLSNHTNKHKHITYTAKRKYTKSHNNAAIIT